MDTPSEILWTLIISSAIARNGYLGNKIAILVIYFFIPIFVSQLHTLKTFRRTTNNRAMLSGAAYMNDPLSKPFLLYACECLFSEFPPFRCG